MRTLRTLIHSMTLFAFLVVFFSVAAYSSTYPPFEIEKGWNLFTPACDIETSSFIEHTGIEGIKVYRWDGTKYNDAKQLEVGMGYALFTPSAIDIDNSYCSTFYTPNEVNYNLHEGWNLVGNPMPVPIDVSAMINLSEQKLHSGFFKMTKKPYSFVEDTALQSMKTYWILAKQPVQFSVVPTVQLEIGLSKNGEAVNTTATATLYLRENVSLSATFRINAPHGDEHVFDVMEDVDWSFSNPEIITMDDAGNLSFNSSGNTTISATYRGLQSNMIAIDVIDSSTMKCEQLVIAYADLYRDYNRGAYDYFNFQLGIFPEQYEYIDEQTQFYPDYYEGPYVENKLRYLPRYRMVWYRPKDEFQLKALCLSSAHNTGMPVIKYNNEEYSYTDVTDAVEWKFDYNWIIPDLNYYDEVYDYYELVDWDIKTDSFTFDGYDPSDYTKSVDYDPGVITHLGGGRFRPDQEGAGAIKAVLNSMESNETGVYVTDTISIKKLVLKPASDDGSVEEKYGDYEDVRHYTSFEFLFPVDKPGKLEVVEVEELYFKNRQCTWFYGQDYYGMKFSPFGCIDAFHNQYCFNHVVLQTEVTENVNWQISGNNELSVGADGQITAGGVGSSSIKTTYGDRESNTITIKTTSDTGLHSVTLNPEEVLKLNPGDGAQLQVLANYFDGDSHCISYYVHAGHVENCKLKSEDVSDAAEYTISNTAAGSITNSFFTAADTFESTYITAKYSGVDSNSIYATVQDTE